MRCVRLILVASAVLTGTLTLPVAHAETVLGLLPDSRRPAATEAMNHIEARLGDGLKVGTTTSGIGQKDLSARAADVDFVLGLDSDHGRVAVYRASDGTFLTRGLGAKTWRSSPFSASLVALELLELARGAPPVVTRRAPLSANAQTKRARPSDTATSSWSLFGAVEAGGALDWSTGNEVTIVRPFVAGELAMSLSSVDLSLQLRFAGFGQTSQLVDNDRVSYRRHDMDAGLAVGFHLSDYWLGSALRLGASYAEVTLPQQGAAAIEDSRFVPWSGLSLMARRAFGAGFAAAFTVDLAWLPQPPRFLVRATPVLYERGFRLRVGLGVRWSSL